MKVCLWDIVVLEHVIEGEGGEWCHAGSFSCWVLLVIVDGGW